MQKSLSVQIHDQAIEEALLDISEAAAVNILFTPNIFKTKKRINLNAKNESLEVILKDCLAGTQVAFKLSNGSIILFKKTLPFFNLSGYLTDAHTGERLIGANIISLETQYGCATNAYGFYSHKFKRGIVRLQVSYLGYETKIIAIDLSKSKQLDIQLEPAITLREVLITPKSDSSLLSGPANELDLPLSWLFKLPATGGEADVMRYLQLIPGIQSGTDGFGGLHVRGGNSDQNLILLDDVPVYNPSHTFGLYSIFNPDLTKSVKLYKGGFPARYEGRNSSVLDIRTKEGNNQELSGSFTVGSTATRGLLEIPIAKNKGSILLAGRRTHVNLWLEPLSRRVKAKNDEVGEMGYHFHDFNLKAHYAFSARDKIYFSHYIGKDNFMDYSEKEIAENETDPLRYSNEDAYVTNWGNTITSVRWNHLFSDRLFSNTTITYSRFDYESTYSSVAEVFFFDEEFEASSFSELYSSKIQDASLRTDFDYFINNQNRLRFGANLASQTFEPGLLSSQVVGIDLDSLDINDIPTNGAAPINTFVFNAYAEQEMSMDKFRINAGLHLATYTNNSNLDFALQPRFTVAYDFSNQLQGHGSATRSVQYLNILTRADAGLPNDLWVPTGSKTGPQNAWQYTLGLSGKLGAYTNWKIETYYKHMKNLLRLDQSTLEGDVELRYEINGDNWEDFVESGSAQNYGFECTLEAKKGKLSGWLAYTWAKSERTYRGVSSPYLFDTRHNLSLTMAYRINHWLDFSANWVYQTGRPFALDIYENQDIPFGSILNTQPLSSVASRLPVYHRLDLGLNAHFKRKHLEHSFQVSIYNTYNRKNIIFAKSVLNNNDPRVNGVTGLPILPSVNYTLAF